MLDNSHTLLRFPDGKTKALSFTWDDGVVEDMWLSERFGELGLRGTFNINSGLFHRDNSIKDTDDEEIRYLRSIQHRMNEEELVNSLDRPYIEIACHGFRHYDANFIDDTTLIWDIMEDRHTLETMFRRPITGFAIPQDSFNDRAIEIYKTCGFEYARTVRCTNDFYPQKDMFHFAPTTQFLSDNVNELADRFLAFVPTTNLFDWNTHGALFNIFGHSYEMNYDRPRFQKHLNSLLEKLAGHDDVWYATNIEIVRYMKAFYGLIFATDRSYVYNPSCFDVWVYTERGTVKIPSGSTVEL